MQEAEIIEKLKAMEQDPAMVTNSAFRANSEVWPDHTISFVDLHLAYIKQHPQTNPSHYLSNLRLKLRLR